MDVPVTTADLTAAKNGCYECSELGKEIERVQACGLNCDEQELRLTHLNQFFQALIEQYGPLVKPGSRSRT